MSGALVFVHMSGIGDTLLAREASRPEELQVHAWMPQAKLLMIELLSTTSTGSLYCLTLGHDALQLLLASKLEGRPSAKLLGPAPRKVGAARSCSKHSAHPAFLILFLQRRQLQQIELLWTRRESSAPDSSQPFLNLT